MMRRRRRIMELASLDDGGQEDGSNRRAPAIAASQHGTAHFRFALVDMQHAFLGKVKVKGEG